MVNPFVSVIVPVYNVQPYIRRCVDSILAQTLSQIEIILVDDGSTDASGSICDEYAERHKDTVKVIHQENKKQSLARKAGVEVSTGEYIAFVDADDWIAPDMLKEMYQVGVIENAQIVLCDLYLVFDLSLKHIKAFPSNVVSKLDFFVQNSPPYMCNKMIHRSMLPHMIFPADIGQAEDTAVMVPLVTYADRLAYVAKPFYYYLQRKTSAIHTFTSTSSVIEHKQGFQWALDHANPAYQIYVAKYCLTLIQYNLGNPRRRAFKADYIEFVKEQSHLFVNNPLIQQDMTMNSVLKHLYTQTIPKRLISATISPDEAYNEYVMMNRKSWHVLAMDYDIVLLDTRKCDINNVPICVKAAYKEGNMRFVEEYLKLQYLYENGGIVTSDDILFNTPLGELRTNRAFFGYLNKKNINSHIYGALPFSRIIKLLLDTYEDNNILNEAAYPLCDRIHDLLVTQYGLSAEGGYSQTLKEDVVVYRCDYLSYDFQNGNSIARIFNETDLLCQRDELRVLIDKSILTYWDEDKNKFFKEREELRKKYNDAVKTVKTDIDQDKKTTIISLQNELQECRDEIMRLKNSKSWRITRPLRRLFNFFRGDKFSTKEVL